MVKINSKTLPKNLFSKIFEYIIKEYIRIKDVVILLNISKLTLRNWDKNKKLCTQKHPINNYSVYLKTEIDGIIEQIKSGEKKIKYTKK